MTPPPRLAQLSNMDLHLSKNNFTAPIKNPATQHTVFEAILLLLIIGLFYWFIILPKKGELNNLRSSYTQLQQDQAKLDTNKANLLAAISDVKEHSQQVSEMDEALPLDGRVTKLYIALDQIVQGSGMTVGNIGISFPSTGFMAGDKTLLADPYAAQRTLQKLPTTLVVSGSIDQFQLLLQRLETSGRLLNVTSVSVQPGGTGGSFDFNVSLEAYYYE